MEEETEKHDFVSREYQVELFNQAVERNLILYLPTGSGKTFIAIMLIKHFNGSKEIKPIDDGGQRTFFLVNTVALVAQQYKHILSQTVLSVGKYSGDMSVDLWTKEQWTEQINIHQVLVMTTQIFVDMIEHNIISLRNVNLIVFDECHHAVGKHPMRQAMMLFKGVPTSEQPRILGLTATLLNGNINSTQVADQIQELEKTFMAKISTSVNEEMVKMYSTNPKESRLSYLENDITGYCYKLRDQILGQLKAFVAAVVIDEVIKPLPGSAPKDALLLNEGYKKTNKRLANLVSDIQVNMDELGIYGGSLALLVHLVQVQQMLPNCPLESTKLIYQSITADCTLLRKYFDIEMKKSGLSSSEAVQHFSSDKVRKLLGALKMLKKGDSALVFVRRRFTAKILYYLVKHASKDDPSFNTIKSNFIVGYNIGNPYKDTRENYVQRNQNKKVLNMFNQGELNVLFASNVVEEGIDITQCNFVIMFDHPIDFRSYVQSKGRARDQNSNYIIMVNRNDDTFDRKYPGFRNVEKVLKHLLYGGKTLYRQAPSEEEIENSLFMETPGLEPFKPMGPDGPIVTYISSISLINRYFATLKNDKFTKISPYWWIQQNKENQFKCFLQLPMESKAFGTVEGTWQQNKDNAKRSVALEACKKLYECGELGGLSMLPTMADNTTLDVEPFTPNVDKNEVFEEIVGEKTIKIGFKKNKRIHEIKGPDCLCECNPQPNQKAYMHVLEMKPTYEPPVFNNRLNMIYETLSMSNSFALISTKILPKIAPFPLYMSTGELEGTVKEAHPIYLDENQLKQISDFHYRLFNNVLCVVKEFLVRDIGNSQNSFLVAPVRLGEMETFVIDWDAIKETSKPFPSTDRKPSDEERMGLQITDDNYFLKIVSPWYRTVPFQKYLITKVCFDMTENSRFPTESYATYKDYFNDKYNIEPLIKNQPLIEVKALSSRLNCTKPRTLTKVLKRKYKEENEDFEVWLMPELCVVYPMHGKYWLKANLLPTVLYRVSRLCIAEELRASIARDTGIGPLSLPQGKNWKKLEEDISLQKKENEPDVQQALRPLAIISKGSIPSTSTQNVWGKEEEPLDIERNMDSASIFDIINYDYFINKPLLGTISETAGVSLSNLTSGSNKPIVLQMVEPPELIMLKNPKLSDGPEQVEVMQALTAAEANDFINGERLETLGDSFLKYFISLTLFESQPDSLEGALTHIKGNVVGNKNLYFCGKKRNLGSILQIHSFAPMEEWLAPGFCVQQCISSVISAVKLDPDLLYSIKIPDSDRRAGAMSVETMNQINDILYEAEDGHRKSSIFLNQQAMTDKNISDSVEALLGVYLKSCGTVGALKVLNWFGVTNPDLMTPDIFTRKPPSPAKGEGNLNMHLQNPNYLEEILNYKFRDRAYMLQALTHPSYTRNNITLCYQRLEFLGDALIDFLITVHIYEKCQTLSPGDLTDLRSALVNNITLGALSVRYQFYKYMLYFSSNLHEVMMRFVKHQESRDHVIDNDILFLIEEKDVKMSEAVDVPKALGDIFESLIGAIYLDSGKNLDVTWKVIYNLMKDEIETFSKDIPKNHVRMLYETNCGPKFISTLDDNGVVMVTLEILHKGVEEKFYGFGDNKHEGKRAAAKHAMRYLSSH